MAYSIFQDKQLKFGSDIYYPDETTSSKIKGDDAYGLQYAKAMYADWRNGQAAVFSKYREKILSNRLYAIGNQSINQYKKLLGDDDKDSSYLNLDWRVAAIIPKFVQIMLGNMLRYDNKFTVNAIDRLSRQMKEEAYWEKYAMIKRKKDIEALSALAGARLTAEEEPDAPQTIEELDVYHDMSFKLKLEIAMEQGLEYVMNCNDWREIEKQVKYDLIVDGIAGTRTYFLNNGYIKIRRVDSTQLVIGQSNKPDFSDLKHIGEIHEITLSELRKIAGSTFTDEQYAEIAHTYQGQYKNPVVSTLPNMRQYDLSQLSGFKIPVLEFEYKTTNRLVDKVKTNEYGNEQMYPAEEDYQPKKDNARRQETDIEVIYTGYWVVGTDFIFNYGLQKNMQKDVSNYYPSYFSWSIYAPEMNDGVIRSKVDYLEPIGNSFQLGWLKIQNLIAQSPPPGLAIEIQGLLDVPIGKGGKTLTPLQLTKLRKHTGNYFWNSRGASGQHNYKPFEQLVSGFEQELRGFISLMNFDLELMRQISGVNEAMDASSPNPEAAVGTSKMAIMGGNNALASLYDAYRTVKRYTIKNASCKILQLKDKGAEATYIKALGEATTRVIELAGESELAEYGIFVEEVMTEQERQYIDMLITESVKKREAEGRGGIELADSFAIRRINNNKMAERYLVMMKKRREREDMQRAEANAQSQSKAQAQLEQAKTQAALAEIQAKSQAKIAEINATKQWDFKIKQLELHGKVQHETVKGHISNMQQAADHMNTMDQMELDNEHAQQQGLMQGATTEQ